MSKRVLYIARNDGTDMRVSKECNSLTHAGYDVRFFGWRWHSRVEPPDPMPNVSKYFYTPKGSGAGSQKALMFPGFARFVARGVRTLRPDIVHCVNEELGLLAVLLQRRHRFRSVCDIFDSMELRWGDTAFPASAAVRGVSRFVHGRSTVLLVTDETRKKRLGRYSRKARVVANYPVDIGEEASRRLPPDDGKIRLYVAGTLYEQRGLKAVLALLDARDDVQVVSAGWLYDGLAQRFVRHPAVDFRGVVTPDVSLEMAASCHAILALYEPSNENNILASPNKIYDALCVGRPVIINRETNVSRWIEDQNLGYVMRYDDVAALEDIVDRLKSHSLQDVSVRLRTLFKQGYSWDVAERTMLDAYSAIC